MARPSAPAATASAQARAGAGTGLRRREDDKYSEGPLVPSMCSVSTSACRSRSPWLTLRNLVELIARVGADEQAAVLYGACTASPTSPPIYGPEVQRLEGVVATLVSRLGQEAFDQARRRGAGLSDEEAVSFASAVTRRLLADDEAPVTAAGG